MTDTAEPMTATAATHQPTDAGDRELVSRYHRDGYVVLPDALSAAEVRALREEAVRICRGELGAAAGVQPSGADEPDELVVRRYLFIPTRDRSLTAAWIALDDATVDNGCLWVLPGSHRPGVLYPDREHHDPQFDCEVEAYDFPYRDQDAVPVEVPAGAAVVFNGYLLHRSLPNTGRHGLRRALVNHYMSAASLLPWMLPPAGVTMGRADHRDIVMVAGTDPYAYKGTTDVMRPHVRPDGQGGCVQGRETTS